METIMITRYMSPAGELIIGTVGDSICLCDWADAKKRDATDLSIMRHLNAQYKERTSPAAERAKTQLDEYFNGSRKAFDIEIAFTGTPFQRAVRAELMNIPYGDTITYGKLAVRAGNPKAVRAVASAIASNPISIFVPCHRVTGSNSKLTGYRGGLPAKAMLLEIEQAGTAGNTPL